MRAKRMSCAKETSCLCKLIFNNWLSRVASSWKQITRIITMFKHKFVTWINSNITLKFQPRSSIKSSEVTDRHSPAKQPFISFWLVVKELPKLGVGQLLVESSSTSPQQCTFCMTIVCLILGNASEISSLGAA